MVVVPSVQVRECGLEYECGGSVLCSLKMGRQYT